MITLLQIIAIICQFYGHTNAAFVLMVAVVILVREDAWRDTCMLRAATLSETTKETNGKV